MRHVASTNYRLTLALNLPKAAMKMPLAEQKSEEDPGSHFADFVMMRKAQFDNAFGKCWTKLNLIATETCDSRREDSTVGPA